MPFLHFISSFEGNSYENSQDADTNSIIFVLFISFYVKRYHFSQIFRKKKKMLRFWVVSEFHIRQCFFSGDPDCIYIDQFILSKACWPFPNKKDLMHIA